MPYIIGMTVIFQDYYPDPANNLREWKGKNSMPCHWCRASIGKGEMYVTVFDNGRFFVAHDESPENCEF